MSDLQQDRPAPDAPRPKAVLSDMPSVKSRLGGVERDTNALRKRIEHIEKILGLPPGEMPF